MSSPANDVTAALRESAYLAVGLGVLAAQRARARARQLTETLSTLQPELAAKGRQRGPEIQALRSGLHQVVRQVDRQVQPYRRHVEGALDLVQDELTGPYGQLFRVGRLAARHSERWLRHRLDL